MLFDIGRELKSKTEKIEGNKYSSEIFEPAKISVVENQTVLVRYNAYDDEIEFSKDGKNFNLVKTENLEVKLVGSKKKYIYTSYSLKATETIYGYLVQATELKHNNIYVKEGVNLVPAKEALTGYDVARPAYFQAKKDEFLIEVAGKIVAVPKKKKDFLSLFGEKATAVESYMKANKVSNSSKEDLIKIATFLNEN